MKISMKKQSDLNLNQGFEKFIQQCSVRNLSPKTIIYYEGEFKRFISYLPETTLLKDISVETIQEYIIFLKANLNANDVTIATYIRAIRAIFYYLLKMVLVLLNLFKNRIKSVLKHNYDELKSVIHKNGNN